MFNSLTCGGQSHSWTHFVRWLFQTVPAGHRHPGTQELLGHGTLMSNLLSHVRWQEGTQSSKTDPPLQETPYNRENRHLMTVDCWPDAHMHEIKRCLLNLSCYEGGYSYAYTATTLSKSRDFLRVKEKSWSKNGGTSSRWPFLQLEVYVLIIETVRPEKMRKREWVLLELIIVF